VLVKLKKHFVDNNGITQEGVFRVAPDESELRVVKHQINTEQPIQCQDINCIPALIKVRPARPPATTVSACVLIWSPYTALVQRAAFTGVVGHSVGQDTGVGGRRGIEPNRRSPLTALALELQSSLVGS
jgi:hypothetical protein